MLRFTFVFLLICGIALAQTQPSIEMIRKDVASVQNSVNEAVNGAVPGFGVLQSAKGAYLDGYGIVVSVEVALETTRNPFSGIRTPAEIRTTVDARRKQVTEKLTDFLKQRVRGLESIGPAESVAIIANLLNTNPADLPDLPSQIVFSVKKEDAASGRINIREYK